jgi:hypothetical protein
MLLLFFCNTSIHILKRTVNITTNALPTWNAPFAPTLACMATCTSSTCAIERLYYFVLFLYMAPKSITNCTILWSGWILSKDKCDYADTFV